MMGNNYGILEFFGPSDGLIMPQPYNLLWYSDNTVDIDVISSF